MKTKLARTQKNILYSILIFLLLQALLIPFFWQLQNYADIAAMLLLLTLITFIATRQALPIYALIGVLIPFVMHSMGIMGAYANVSLILTYDKWMHLFGGFGVTLFAFGMLEELPLWKRAILVFLIAMGLGALTEVAEFIGYFYVGIEHGGLFTFGDGQVQTGSPLQLYDSYFDLIFQAIGNILAIFFVTIRSACRNARR